MSDTPKPLVTFALLAYNQAGYVRHAITGALAQDYSPLQIIFSDDCSSDDTFEIMQQAVRDYRGPHTIVLNRNPTNLNIGGHVKKLASIVSGKFVVVAAGDDVSEPTRVTETMAAFASASNVFAVFSDLSEIDEHGEFVRTHVRKWNQSSVVSRIDIAKNGGGVATGATYAYRKECFFWPAEYPDKLMNEDRILPFRAAMLGQVVHSDKPLVRYRLSAAGVSRALPPEQLWATLNKAHINELSLTLSAASDAGLVPPREVNILRRIVGGLGSHSRVIMRFQGMDNWIGRVGFWVADNWFNRDTFFARGLTKLRRSTFYSLVGRRLRGE